MTFKILTADTRKVISRSEVRTAEDPFTQNKRTVDLVKTMGEPAHRFVRSKRDNIDASDHTMSILEPINDDDVYKLDPNEPFTDLQPAPHLDNLDAT